MISVLLSTIGAYSELLARFSFIFVISFVVLFFIKRIIIAKLSALAKKTETNLDDFMIDVLKTWNWLVLAAFSFFIAVQFVPVPSQIHEYLFGIMVVLLTWYGIQTVSAVISFGFSRYISQRERYEDDFDPTMILFLRQIATVLVWIIAGLLVLQNLGFQISALVGGLGLGGLAVAFAVQNLLSDVFSSISIYFDKPFKIGDFIVVGQDSGIVKKIGIKSTRLQTLQGEELIISNKELTESRVNNFKRMQSRRIVQIIGVEYGTPVEKLKKIPQIIQKIIEKNEDVIFDRSHFKTFGDFSLQFETVYRVNSPEFQAYMDVQQRVNLAIIEAFKKEGISMAFPTQKIITAKR